MRRIIQTAGRCWRCLRSRSMDAGAAESSRHGHDALFEMQSAIKRLVDHAFEIGTVIDIGASNGKWTQMAMQHIPAAAFFAIEPLAERKSELELLKQHDARFDYALCVAGAVRGEVEMSVTEDLDGSTVSGDRGSLRRVPVQSLDEIVTARQLPAPFLLKFDTHGYEVPILEGASQTLENTNVIIMEVYNFDVSEHAVRFPQMCQKLESLGFRCYDMASPRLRSYDHALWQMDLFFARKSSAMFSHQQYR